MLTINGEKVNTVSDAAHWFGVSVKTVREWINKGIIPEPPTKEHGIKEVHIFPDEYLEDAALKLKEYRKQRRASKKRKN